MPVNEQQVRSLASDARIAVSDAELASLTADLNQILEHIEMLKGYDLEGVPLTFHPIPDLRNAMREDITLASLPQAVALANARQTEEGQFKVPPILAESGVANG